MFRKELAVIEMFPNGTRKTYYVYGARKIKKEIEKLKTEYEHYLIVSKNVMIVWR